ncbi:MAG: AmmeMemoRadiSam system protein B [Chloroflexi bacterium]|nr:AmmeMemoRadiSam system protein B [Chloroflexota bacterium]
MSPIESIRPSPIAGSWYSANPSILSKEIHGYLDQARVPEIHGQIIGLIAPHAGYLYSGQTAGHAYKCVQGDKTDLCVILSPLHAYNPYPLLSSAHAAFSTPLGIVDIDQDLLKTLKSNFEKASLPTIQPIAMDREHSLEIQLPFLQTALQGPFQLLPLMVRTQDPIFLQKTAQILAKTLQGKKVLVVASTDLSHFYEEKKASSFDQVMIERMVSFLPESVLDAEQNQEGFACGAGAVALALWTLKQLGGNQVSLLHYSNSAKVSGDPSSVVGYGALAITKYRGS